MSVSPPRRSSLLPNDLRQALGLGGVDLEERRRRDPEGAAEQLFGVVRLSGLQRYLLAVERRLHEHVGRVDPVSDRELARLLAAAVELAQHVVDPVRHEHAAVDVDETPGDPVDEAEPSASAHCEPPVVAVPELLGRRSRRGYGHGAQRLVRLQLGPDRVPLQIELVRVVDVLPLTAAARPEEGARRGDAVGRGVDDLGDDA